MRTRKFALEIIWPLEGAAGKAEYTPRRRILESAESSRFGCPQGSCNMYLKPSQNKKGQKNFQLHRFLNTLLQLAADKKYSKNGASRKIFGSSYFVTALACIMSCSCQLAM